MPRTILVHLNVEVPADDNRPADEIMSSVMGALEVGGVNGGSEEPEVADLMVTVPLYEEI